MNITPIPAFHDNYIWCIDNGTEAIVFCPGTAEPVLTFLAEHRLQLCAVLVTHRHHDHVNGVAELVRHFNCPIYEPAVDPQCPHSQHCQDGDQVTALGLNFTVIATPGHTRGHISYYSAPWLFCGDVLFGAGCGNLSTDGNAFSFARSLQRLCRLPPDTLIFGAHEYTISNIAFALTVEPNNTALQARQDTARKLRTNGQPTLPTTLALELATNPFLRCDQASVKAAVEAHTGDTLSSQEAVFTALRHWKSSRH